MDNHIIKLSNRCFELKHNPIPSCHNYILIILSSQHEPNPFQMIPPSCKCSKNNIIFVMIIS